VAVDLGDLVEERGRVAADQGVAVDGAAADRRADRLEVGVGRDRDLRLVGADLLLGIGDAGGDGEGREREGEEARGHGRLRA